MPQLAMWATRHPVTFTTTYTYSPTDPHGGAVVSQSIRDQSGRPIANASVRVDGVHLDEMVADVMETGWLTYLYGTPDDLQHAISIAARRWRNLPSTPMSDD